MAIPTPETATSTKSSASQKRQLLNHLVDTIARESPQRLYAEFPVSATGYDSGYKKVTYSEFANAINGVAWWLHNELGPARDQEFPTLAYIGANDVRYNAVILGAVKVGYKILLASPRNSIRAQENLFSLLDCKILITTSPQAPGVTAMLAALSNAAPRVIDIPHIEELVTKPHPYYSYEKTFSRARNDPLVVVHTSGTTELPKPIIWTHDYVASCEDTFTVAPLSGSVSQQKLYGVRVFNTLPLFHAGGVFFSLLNPLLNNGIHISPAAGLLPSAQLVINGLKHTTADVAILVPPYVNDIAQNAAALDFLSSKLDYMFYIGGSVSKASGDIISKKVKFCGIIGSTEACTYPLLKRPQDWLDWEYYYVHPSMGPSFEHRSEDLYELILMKNSDPENEQCVFKLFPELHVWRTNDLWSPHPTKPDLWVYRGRADDIIVFLTGEKTNPITMEHHLIHHSSEIHNAIVIGTQRFQAALLLQLKTEQLLSKTERAEMIEHLWPIIQETNSTCPQHAKIAKSHVLFTEPGKPMVTSAKGTIQRGPTLGLYVEAIDKLYADADKISIYSQSGMGPDKHVDIRDEDAVHQYVHNRVSAITGWKEFEDTENFFLRGMDSLQSLQLIRESRKGLQNLDITITTIYTNPSVNQLCNAITDLFRQETVSKPKRKSTRQKSMESLLEYHKKLVDQIPKPEESFYGSAPHSRVILLTGSTGSLGSHILHYLLQDKTISHIYCLNRSPSASSRQQQRARDEGLSAEFPIEKVTFLHADLSMSFLGLETEIYNKLQSTTTEIIHNSWPVNFNLSLDTFAPQLTGIVNLIAFAASISHTSSLLFTSSISSVSRYPLTPIPEILIDDMSAPLFMGYAESKFLSELILAYAAPLFSHMQIRIARVGQLAGPVKTSGTWKRNEWFPSLVISSYYLGIVPETLGSAEMKIDWVPVDILACVLLDLLPVSSSREEEKSEIKAEVYHPLNTHPTTWTHLLPSIIRTLSQSKHITTVPFPEWLQQVRAAFECKVTATEFGKLMELNPAVKLLDFYEGWLLGENNVRDMTVGKALERSELLGLLNGVQDGWMEKWIAGWL